MKFRDMSTEERLRMLLSEGHLDEQDTGLLAQSPGLPTDVASNMIENQIGTFPVPLGLAQHFIIDGKPTIVPLALEEPSVIAAASNAAKRCYETGGFTTSVKRGGLTGQVVFNGTLDQPEQFLKEHREAVEVVAQTAHPSLVAHGGGLRNIEVLTYRECNFIEFRLTIDPAEAMGANVVNTICEAVGHYLCEQAPSLKLLMAILSNNAPLQSAHAQAVFPFTQLSTAQMDGAQVAERMILASTFAEISQQRAATQNKGIMNGVDAVILATGNDTRNIAAAAYSVLNPEHRTWTHWTVSENCLIGDIDIPMPLGAIGGAISTLPVAQLVMKLLGNPSASQLMGIAASVGLASNMAALFAIVTDGIQKGHMNLQLRSLAIMAGATGEQQIEQVANLLRQDVKLASLDIAKKAVSQIKRGSRDV